MRKMTLPTDIDMQDMRNSIGLSHCCRSGSSPIQEMKCDFGIGGNNQLSTSLLLFVCLQRRIEWPDTTDNFLLYGHWCFFKN